VSGASKSARPWSALCILLLLTGTALPDDAAPMTNEDVVRMTGERVATGAIISAIRRAPATRFDLDPEVVIELRHAGVADAVIEAMREAHAASLPPGTAAAPASPADSSTATGGEGNAARVPLVLSFVPWSDRRPPEPGGRPQVEAPARDSSGVPLALAFYLMCLDPTHVPDGWMASPLAGGYPRHHLLWFHEARPVEEPGSVTRLKLDLPEDLPLQIEPGAHTLHLGLAARRGEEPWGPLAEAWVRLKEGNASPIKLRVAVSGRSGGRRTRSSGYRCRVEAAEPAGAVEILTPPAAPP
jgi:hypothetical protein